MNDLDRRLHHASRRLREMPVDVPPLAALGLEPAPSDRRPPEPRRAARVPAGMAAVLLVLGGAVGFTIGQTRSAPTTEYAAPTAADRMRDPVPRLAVPAIPADEIAMMPSQVGPSRLQLRW